MPTGISAGLDVTRTVDGRDLAAMWAELQATITVLNSSRTSLVTLLSSPVTVAAEDVPQGVVGGDFEEASEFGLPTSLRSATDLLTLGYPLRWWDKRTAFSFKFLLDATAAQVAAVHNSVLEADNRLVFSGILRAILNPTRRVNEQGNTIYGAYAGAAGDVPPAYLGTTFPVHNHYLTSGSAIMDGTDLEAIVRTVSHHGFGLGPGTKLLVIAHPNEADVIRSFRAGVIDASGAKSRWDFIPGAGAPAFLTDQVIVGAQAPSRFESVDLIGSFGPAFVVESALLPPGYTVAVATGGADAAANAVAVREHPRPEMRGLVLGAGPSPTYPLQDSVYARGFGTGMRHRGAAAVLQTTTAAAYAVPGGYA